MSPSLQRSAGFTLVELLVGIALGVLTVSAVLLFFVSNKQHFLVQLEASRLQENQRFVVQFLTRDIRGAGYRGCAGGDGLFFNTLNNPSAPENNFQTGLEGFDEVSEILPEPLASTFAGSRRVPIAGTDVLLVRGPEGDASGVRRENSGQQVFAVVRSRETKACTGGTNRINGICPGDYLLISDCQKARIFQVGSIDDSGAITHPTGGLVPGNSDGTWGGTAAPPDERFGIDSEIIRYGTFIYYIAHNPGGEPALYRKASRGRTEELVEGVEDMQILYGENTDADADGTPDRFVAAAGVTDWNDVTAVRIWALLRGFRDHMAEAEQHYPALDGTLVTAPDKRLRRTLLLTIGLRNRLP
ncbi:PilW family protein [Candidatus Thiosymbion oneisti]|uniref:PilW family protein n=1 Tax=Candidatus Thiosymbion oneisti TaxID=589554 RepID=UPI0013FD6868|nr:PilW family protein [Candidatus Thiosymbion oneisti]